MAIDIGDAVLTFYGDLTQLDAAFNKVNAEAGAKLGPATTQVQGLGQGFQDAGKEAQGFSDELDATGLNAAYAGEQILTSTALSGRSLREAKGEAALLGEQFGIHLPRHVRTFLAEIPGIGTALSAAFTATAVLFLVEALVQGAEKLSNWIANTFIFTEAEKKANEELIAQNKEIEKLTEQTKKLREERELASAKSPYEKDLILAQQHAKDLGTVEAAQKKLNDTLAEAARLRTEIAGTPKFDFDAEGAAVASARYAQLTDELRDTEKQVPLLKAQLDKLKESEGKDTDTADKDSLARQIAIGDQRLAFEKKYAAQSIDIEKDRAAAAKNLDKEDAQSGQTQAALDFAFALNQAREKLEAEKNYQQQVISLHNRGTAEDLDKQKEAQNAITLAEQHAQAERVKAWTEFRKKIHDIQEKSVTEDSKKNSELLKRGLDDEVKAYEQTAKASEELARANQRLAESEKNLHEAETKRDFSQLEQGIVRLAQFGIISEEQKAAKLKQLYQDEKDLALSFLQTLLAQEQEVVNQAQARVTAAQGNPFFTDAQLKELQKNLALAQAAVNHTLTEITKETATADKKIDAMTVSFLQLAKAIDKGDLSLGKFAALWQKDIPKMGQTVKHLEILAKDAFDGFAKAAVSAYTEAILGQASFGQAMEAATAQVLAQISAQSAVYAVFYTALGFAKLAMWDFSAAANAFTAAGIYASVAGATGLAGHALAADASNSGSSSSGSASSATVSPAQQAQQTPVVKQNVLSFASGAIVTQPTMAMIGDTRSGGSQTEGVFPLDDPQAIDMLAQRFGFFKHALGHSEIHVHIKGDVIDHRHLMKHISRQVNRGQGRLTAGNSFRVTRRG